VQILILGRGCDGPAQISVNSSAVRFVSVGHITRFLQFPVCVFSIKSSICPFQGLQLHRRVHQSRVAAQSASTIRPLDRPVPSLGPARASSYTVWLCHAWNSSKFHGRFSSPLGTGTLIDRTVLLERSPAYLPPILRHGRMRFTPQADNPSVKNQTASWAVNRRAPLVLARVIFQIPERSISPSFPGRIPCALMRCASAFFPSFSNHAIRLRQFIADGQRAGRIFPTASQNCLPGNPATRSAFSSSRPSRART